MQSKIYKINEAYINNQKIFPQLIKVLPYQRITDLALFAGQFFAPNSDYQLISYDPAKHGLRLIGQTHYPEYSAEMKMTGIATVRLIYADRFSETPIKARHLQPPSLFLLGY